MWKVMCCAVARYFDGVTECLQRVRGDKVSCQYTIAKEDKIQEGRLLMFLV